MRQVNHLNSCKYLCTEVLTRYQALISIINMERDCTGVNKRLGMMLSLLTNSLC